MAVARLPGNLGDREVGGAQKLLRPLIPQGRDIGRNHPAGLLFKIVAEIRNGHLEVIRQQLGGKALIGIILFNKG